MTELLCNPGRSHLLVVDIQEKLAVAMDEAERTQVYYNAGRLARAAGMLNIPVTVTEQYPQGIGHTAGQVLEQLPETARVLDKTSFSCCGDPGIMDALKSARRPQVIVCGMEAHVCVLQTALRLTQEGFQVFVVEDGICSRAPRNRDNALTRMARAGVLVTNAESVMFEWLGECTHPRFKDLLKLIR
ncbi:hydrolase [Ectothiorhodospira haloalkaliphila]|uniref:hydrolase n=1 Tax=Ectothiorhodospira haloalkaliphila TaxID=421628 RepID=UPI001EE87BEB|nr:hydrolase [Ectothiorhodospira haloalkaliphila]MCG5523504.1 hydrolase [Ectothiorhodospira haloalkaliphila]